ncbi:MAG: hypothetical protein ABIU63_06700 [Chitinophagaceae bacterium]
MDRNNYDNDFEEFLKQKSDQYKMYPSDRVWNNIYSSFHGRKKWWALGFTLFFIGSAFFIGRQVLFAEYNEMATGVNQSAQAVAASSPVQVYKTAPGISTISPGLPATTTAIRTIETIKRIPQAASNPGLSTAPVIISEQDSRGTTVITAESTGIIENMPPAASIAASKGASQSESPALLPSASATKESNAVKAIAQPKAAEKINQVEQAAAKKIVSYSRWSMQVYASPTISYRRLSTLNQQGDSYVPVAAATGGNINNYVQHKPAPGFELGSNVQYRLSSSLTVFAGAQLNYSRYYIDAYKYSTEKASIALNGSPLHDTLSGYTNIRNFSGYAPEQLQNKYLQLSLPVGIEIKLLGEKNLQFSIAGGIQPTFLLTSTSYLISSDYKNYIQSPDLARGFNVHTNFEAFVSYKVGGLKWQVGPQFRSQLLSSYSNEYRVREYLTEYGIKFGVTRSF